MPVRAPEHRRTVAVTGANTFLGRELVGRLDEDEEVGKIVFIDIRAPGSMSAKSRFYEVDLTAPGVDSRVAEILEAEQVDDLAHLAFAARPTQATGWAHELESVGTMHLLHACRRRPPRHLVLASTTLVYGPHPSNPNFLTESHPVRGLPGSTFVADKVDAEAQVLSYAAAQAGSRVTVLRLAPMLGPSVDNHVTRWLSRRLVPTVLGHDPLLQFLHELDAVAALKHALDRGVAGVFNVAGHGVLPVSTVLKLAGRVAAPIPYRLLRGVTTLWWVAQFGDAPAAMVAALRYLCVVDASRARDVLGFEAAHTGRDALLDFEGALRLRHAGLLREVA
jgi:UDP-glucose 4-epimerase